MTLPRNEGDDLWEAVFAAPADDAPRRALAAFLRDRSDPADRARVYTGGKLPVARCNELRSELCRRFPSLSLDFV